MENYKIIEQLAPFGVGNPKPLFLFEGVEVSGIKKFGKASEHLELTLTDPHPASPLDLTLNPSPFKGEGAFIRGRREEGVKAMQFFKNEKSFSVPISIGEKINLLANFEKSTFRNKTELRLRIIDIIE